MSFCTGAKVRFLDGGGLSVEVDGVDEELSAPFLDERPADDRTPQLRDQTLPYRLATADEGHSQDQRSTPLSRPCILKVE